MKLKVKRLHKDAKLPSYAHPGDVGLDIYSIEEKTLKPGEHHIFFVGFALEFPTGYAAIMADKGGVAKAGMHVMGGVYDPGYRGEYNIHLVNLSDKPHTFEKGDKLAQLVIYPVEIAQIEEATELSEHSRGEGRFGSTGKK